MSAMASHIRRVDSLCSNVCVTLIIPRTVVIYPDPVSYEFSLFTSNLRQLTGNGVKVSHDFVSRILREMPSH